MALLDLITPEVVKVPVESAAKPDVIRELLQLLKDAGRITAVDPAEDAVLAREALCSTGLEEGIAVPHAKTDTVKILTMAIGIAPQGIDFDAIDGQPTRLLFLLLAPPDKSGPHIQALAEVARVTRSTGFLKLLLAATSPQEVVDLFDED